MDSDLAYRPEDLLRFVDCLGSSRRKEWNRSSAACGWRATACSISSSAISTKTAASVTSSWILASTSAMAPVCRAFTARPRRA